MGTTLAAVVAATALRGRGCRASAHSQHPALRGNGEAAVAGGAPMLPAGANTCAMPPPVGAVPHDRSPFGLLDCAGGVREWTATPAEDGHFVVMGGGWRDAPYEHRVTRRESVEAKAFANDLGFRCVVDVGGR